MHPVRPRCFDVDVGRRRRPEHERRGAVQPRQLGPHVVLGGIEQVGGAEIPRQFQAAPAQVDGHHIGDTAVGQGGDGEEADRPATEDGDRVARSGLALVHRLHAHRRGLGQRGDRQRHRVGYREESSTLGRLAHEEQRGETAFAGTAPQASELLVDRVDDDTVADGGARHLVADPLDDAGQLVTQGHGMPGQPPHVDVGHVGAADPTGGDPDEGVTRSGVGFGDLVEADVVRPVHADLLHRAPLPEAGAAWCSSTGPDPRMRQASALDRRRPAGKRSPRNEADGFPHGACGVAGVPHAPEGECGDPGRR